MTNTETKTCCLDFEPLQETLRKLRLAEPKGVVVRVSGLILESSGPSAGLGQLCQIRLRCGRTIEAEVVGFHDSQVILLPLDSLDGVAPGDVVTALDKPRMIAVSPALRGRVLDGLGQPIDQKGPIPVKELRPLQNSSPDPLRRKMIDQPLPLGIRAIDGLLTCGKGQRIGVFAGSGVGKSVLLGEIANGSSADINVVALVGERGREVR